MALKPNVLIIGSLPPPIGGVSIHVQRLLARLEGKVCLWDHRRESKLQLLRKIKSSEIIHFHINNPYKRCLLILICRFIFFKKTILTYHGNLERYRGLWHIFDILSILITNKPLVINGRSLELARSFNKNSELVTAFIPPSSVSSDGISRDEIELFCSQNRVVICTNVHKFSYDPDGRETYGIEELINFTQGLREDVGLVISDPLGTAKEFYENKNNLIPDNVLFITTNHDFNYILKKCDIFIRNTSTDGDSISVREALYWGKPTFATDCVDRPDGVAVYKRGELGALSKSILNIKDKVNDHVESADGAVDLMRIYKRI